MSPLVETIALVAIAIAVILLVCGLFAKAKKVEKVQPEEQIESVPEERDYLVFKAKPIKAAKNGDKIITYESTHKYAKYKDNYYEVMKSSNDKYFYTNGAGNRVYLKEEAVSTLTPEEEVL